MRVRVARGSSVGMTGSVWGMLYVRGEDGVNMCVLTWAIQGQSSDMLTAAGTSCEVQVSAGGRVLGQQNKARD